MTRLLVVAVMILLNTTVVAQFGVGAKYQSISSTELSDYLASIGGQFSNQLVGGSVYYWFRVENRRIEFLPEIGYLSTFTNTADANVTGLQKIAVSFNTDFYLFDLEGDCDCPTFSKQGGYFQKGFFLEVTPGIDMQFYELIDADGFLYNESQLTYRIGLGAGFDFGVSDMVTITPTIGYNWSSNPNWYSLGVQTSSEWIFSAGLRAIFRPDYRRKYR